MKKTIYKEVIDKNIFIQSKAQSAMLTLWEMFLAVVVVVLLVWAGTFIFFLIYI